jgi:hypothetical protein
MTTITIERALLEQALKALEYHTQQTRPIQKTEHAILAIRAELAKPSAPAWHDAPTEPGLWMCNDGDDNPYRRTTHRVTFPLNQLLVGENERWYGPIPQDKEGGAT